MHINAIGGDSPGKTELAREILLRSDIFVEYAPQTRIEGEIQQLDMNHPGDRAVARSSSARRKAGAMRARSRCSTASASRSRISPRCATFANSSTAPGITSIWTSSPTPTIPATSSACCFGRAPKRPPDEILRDATVLSR